MYYTDDGEEQL